MVLSNAIRLVNDRVLVVTHALRGRRIRLISARLAEPQERRQYHEKAR